LCSSADRKTKDGIELFASYDKFKTNFVNSNPIKSLWNPESNRCC